MSAEDIGAWVMCARTAAISWAPLSNNKLDVSTTVVPPMKKVTINVSGRRYETYDYTLFNHQKTLLGGSDKKYFYDEKNQEYYFDCDPDLFRFILNYYRTGKLHCPKKECAEYFEKELEFFGIKTCDMAECCCNAYWSKKNDMKLMQKNVLDKSVGIKIKHSNKKLTFREKIWKYLENPQLTWIGKLFYYITGVFITLSVFSTVFETVECEKGFNCGKKYKDLFFAIETCCVVVFTAEYFARLYGAPNRLLHARSVASIIDIAAVLPYFIGLFITKTVFGGAFISLRVFRVFRIFKFSRHSKGLRILGCTLLSCASELGFLLFSLSLAVVIFSTIIYYIEKDEQHTHFTSIPAGFWYTVVTMTTLGYGDMVPKTVLGKLVGSVCSLCGVLVIALPVPVIVNSFSKIYMGNQRSDNRIADLKLKNGFEKKNNEIDSSIANMARERINHLSKAYTSLMDLHIFGKDIKPTKNIDKVYQKCTTCVETSHSPNVTSKPLFKHDDNFDARCLNEEDYRINEQTDQVNLKPLIVVDLIDDKISI
ncbi:potassium voltage-gated channel protein Shal isoform X2 [Hydra vulgaris]|uniref:Potassium voltage-gated channel protein Shal isoform X2 n=1 Tax=Hydra vulgaris TaxID=6087 RepID=A0ABM4DGM0_HYDVU